MTRSLSERISRGIRRSMIKVYGHDEGISICTYRDDHDHEQTRYRMKTSENLPGTWISEDDAIAKIREAHPFLYVAVGMY